MSKKSIRFYKDHKVRAVWNEDGTLARESDGWVTVFRKPR